MMCFLYLLFSHLKFRAKVFTEFPSIKEYSNKERKRRYVSLSDHNDSRSFFSTFMHQNNHTGFSFNKETKNTRSVLSDDMFPYQRMITHVTSQVYFTIGYHIYEKIQVIFQPDFPFNKCRQHCQISFHESHRIWLQ